MARASKDRRSETLTIRLDPKTRFILEYLSRLKGQTITTIVERAIVKAADQETLQHHDIGDPLGWQDFWDVSEGVRALKLAGRSEFFPNYDEEKRLAFCKEHWPLFWSNEGREVFLNHYVDILWPRIDEFIQLHEEKRAKDYFAARNAMMRALDEAKLSGPSWVKFNKGPDAPQEGLPD